MKTEGKEEERVIDGWGRQNERRQKGRDEEAAMEEEARKREKCKERGMRRFRWEDKKEEEGNG